MRQLFLLLRSQVIFCVVVLSIREGAPQLFIWRGDIFFFVVLGEEPSCVILWFRSALWLCSDSELRLQLWSFDAPKRHTWITQMDAADNKTSLWNVQTVAFVGRRLLNPFFALQKLYEAGTNSVKDRSRGTTWYKNLASCRPFSSHVDISASMRYLTFPYKDVNRSQM